MSKAEYTFSGTLSFPFLTGLNRYDKYATNFYPKEAEDRKAIKATGTRCSVKEDPDGGLFYTFTAPKEHPPKVVDAEGKDVTVLVGNGSEARIRIVVEKFSSQKWGEVTRTVLTDVVIDKLIPYEKKEVAPDTVSSDTEQAVGPQARAKMPF